MKKEESWLQYVPSGWCVFMRRRSKKWGVAEFLFLLEVFLANVCDRRFCFEPLEKVWSYLCPSNQMYVIKLNVFAFV